MNSAGNLLLRSLARSPALCVGRTTLFRQLRNLSASSSPITSGKGVAASKAFFKSDIQSLISKRFQSGYSGYQQPGFPSVPAIRTYTDREWWLKMAGTAGVVAAATVGINYALNRETRDPLDAFEKSYLNQTFTYVGLGLTIVTGVAVAMHKNGISHRIMRANPWVVMGVSLVGSIGSMMGVFYTSPDNVVGKHLCWLGFQTFQALTLSPLLFMNPALLARAGLYTAGVMGSLAYVGATARSDQYLYMGGPLLAGLVVVALSSLAPMVLPVTAMRTLAVSEALSLYGGLAVFGGFTLYDTQKMLAHAREAKMGRIPADPVRESISFELDFINIFIRMVTILSNGQRRK